MRVFRVYKNKNVVCMKVIKLHRVILIYIWRYWRRERWVVNMHSLGHWFILTNDERDGRYRERERVTLLLKSHASNTFFSFTLEAHRIGERHKGPNIHQWNSCAFGSTVPSILVHQVAPPQPRDTVVPYTLFYSSQSSVTFFLFPFHSLFHLAFTTFFPLNFFSFYCKTITLIQDIATMFIT